ncbi:hypothetical protein ACU1JV_12745 [Paenibacillus sp. T2-29]
MSKHDDAYSEILKFKRNKAHEIHNILAGLRVADAMEVLDRARTSIMNETRISVFHERSE